MFSLSLSLALALFWSRLPLGVFKKKGKKNETVVHRWKDSAFVCRQRGAGVGRASWGIAATCCVVYLLCRVHLYAPCLEMLPRDGAARPAVCGEYLEVAVLMVS